jgi:hypothetical protein
MRCGSLVTLILLAGCASHEPAEPPADKFAQIDASNIADAQKAGYKIVNENGNTMYCRKDHVLGSRVKYVTTCLTQAQWTAQAEAARRSMATRTMAKPIPGTGP